MNALNRAVGALADLALSLVAPLAPAAVLILASLATAAVALLVYGVVSDQDGIARVRRRIHAGLLEIRLLNGSPRPVLHAQTDIVKATGRYVRLSGTPLLVLTGPLPLGMAQLNATYGYRSAGDRRGSDRYGRAGRRRPRAGAARDRRGAPGRDGCGVDSSAGRGLLAGLGHRAGPAP